MAPVKLVDDPDTCVDSVLSGLTAAFPRLRVLSNTRDVVLSGRPSDTVGLVSGGGAGHEPYSAGFVGEGMLAGAVSGSVFAAPPSAHVLRALSHVSKKHKGGVLLFIPNYTGDCLNFGLATEWARRDGIQVESIILGEDCALLESGKVTKTGRRGMCGMVLLFKIAGQLAANGLPLKEVQEGAQKVLDNMATMGVVLQSCTVPGSTNPLLTLAPGSVELGAGVHGEAGSKRIQMTTTADLISQILGPINLTLKLKSGEKVAVLFNNLGGLSNLEQWVVVDEVRKQIEAWGVEVVRLYAGPVMTSLETSGLQVCILKLVDDEWVKCLDANTSAPGWPGTALSVPSADQHLVDDAAESKGTEVKKLGPELEHGWVQILVQALEVVAKDLIAHSDKLNELDSGCGDGDCGATLARLARGIITKLPTLSIKHPAQLLLELANLASFEMGGTSGAVYGLLFSAASAELSKVKCVGNAIHFLKHIAQSWEEGLQGVMRYSKAREGDRTMLDALIPACAEFYRHISAGKDGHLSLEAATSAAEKGCNSTAQMAAKAGRASYVNDSHLGNVDAGAFGVVVWLKALCKAYKSR